MDYKELQNELRILFNDDTAKIILKEDYEDIQKIKSYEYETKKSKNYYKRLFKYTYLNYLDVIFTFLTFFKVADLRVLATFFFPPIIEQ
jgi:hypothetical protein